MKMTVTVFEEKKSRDKIFGTNLGLSSAATSYVKIEAKYKLLTTSRIPRKKRLLLATSGKH